MNRLLFLFFAILSMQLAVAQKADEKLFKKEETFISKHLMNGKVNYQTVINDSIAFGKILEGIAYYNIDNAAFNTQKAFYINAYNLLVISHIGSHFPVVSPDSIEGFFNKKKYTVAGQPFTLNQLETKIFDSYKDWLIQWALINGKGCSFPMRFYPAGNVNQELIKQQIEIYNGRSFIMQDDASKTIWLHQQFAVLQRQLDTSKTNLLVHINLNRNRQLPFNYKIEYFSCTGLNDSLFDKPFAEKQISDTANATDRFDMDLGLDIPSNFIQRGHFELRATDLLYTQQSLYNNKMNRIDDSLRYSYNTFTFKGTYGITDFLNVGFYASVRHALTEDKNQTALNVFTAPAKYKNINESIQVFAKVKLYEKKTRLSVLTSVTMPIQTKLPGEDYEKGIVHYINRANLIYDIFFTTFLRTTITAGNDFDYYPEIKKVYYRFRPSVEFNAQIIQLGIFRGTAGMDFNWNYGKNGFINMTAREYVALNIKLAKHFNVSTNYNYFFIGKNTGAGHYFTGGIRYLF